MELRREIGGSFSLDEAKVLLVDDEREISKILEIALRKEGIEQIRIAETGYQAIEIAQKFHPNVIVLDVMLPDLEGYEVCQEIRTFSLAPILFLTAKSSDLAKLKGFQLGGDDYITKPFHPLEVVARIQAQLRRMKIWQQVGMEIERKKIYTFGNVTLNESSGQLLIDGVEMACPAMEFKLLAYLCAHPNRVFSRQQLFEAVWGVESIGEESTVMVHVRRIREKIERNPSRPLHLLTVRGLGYKLVMDR
ncbi:response regulator transcription factor [Risungbinella massiliensis]|uniref:response regulator transcription factor n=1 Tax=Risungbinella massiliensis TaxID=1329796 RepID=UPI001E3198F8|nr:response regulator transcription factor [Risungbinella massiliensis]